MSKKKQKAGAAPDEGGKLSVAAHPRASASVRRTRARVALVVFAIVLYLSLKSGVPGQEAVLRALVAGIVGNLVARACAIAVWRSLIMAEVKVAGEAHRARREAALTAAAEAVETEKAARAAKAATA
jgi:hypothetical protein